MWITQLPKIVVNLLENLQIFHTNGTVACVAGAWKETRSPLACLPPARTFSLSPITSKRLLRRLMERLSLEQLFHKKMSLGAPDISADSG